MVCSFIPGTAWSNRSAQMPPPPGSTPDFLFTGLPEHSTPFSYVAHTPLYCTFFQLLPPPLELLRAESVSCSPLCLQYPAQLGGHCPEALRATVPIPRGLPLGNGVGGPALEGSQEPQGLPAQPPTMATQGALPLTRC